MADLDEEEGDRFPVEVNEDDDDDLLAMDIGRPSITPDHTDQITSAGERITKKKHGIRIESFEIIRVLGKGCAGKVRI